MNKIRLNLSYALGSRMEIDSYLQSIKQSVIFVLFLRVFVLKLIRYGLDFHYGQTCCPTEG